MNLRVGRSPSPEATAGFVDRAYMKPDAAAVGEDRVVRYSHRKRFTDTRVLSSGNWLCVASQSTLITW